MTTPRRRRSDESVHDYQHELIEERTAKYRAAPKNNVGLNRYRRREAYKSAVWTLDGHLRSQHGMRHTVGLPLTLDECESRHTAYHAENL